MQRGGVLDVLRTSDRPSGAAARHLRIEGVGVAAFAASADEAEGALDAVDVGAELARALGVRRDALAIETGEVVSARMATAAIVDGIAWSDAEADTRTEPFTAEAEAGL